jgi:hypothetical protein
MKKSELRQIIKEEYNKILKTQLNEISAEEMMNGLTKIKSMESFKASAIDMFNDLSQEGFEPDEISDFLHNVLEMQLNPRNVDYDNMEEASKEEVENQKELNKELEKTTNIKKQMSSLNEEDDDDDSPTDKEPTAKDLKNDSVAVLASKLKKIEAEMKSTVKKWKTSEGAEKAKLTQRLKELTTQKKEIEKFL